MGWMSNVAYDNMSFEDDDDNLDDNFLERLNHDSLDVNVLNCANLNTINRSEDDGYAGSTLRMGSSMNKTLMNMPANNSSAGNSKNSSPQRRIRSQSHSRSSSTSGLGS